MTLAANYPDHDRLLSRLCDTASRVVFFPVRHHSPAAAALVADWIKTNRPAAVLVEGPSDYNHELDQLLLDHQLPIAIYSYFRTDLGTCGAYYPFCEYSPEWLAITSAPACGAMLRFIDLPWSDVSRGDSNTHRYADAHLRRGRYIEQLCRTMHVEDFDGLWDKLIESHRQLSLEDYLARVHGLCLNIRLWEEEVTASDAAREAYMTERIREVMTQLPAENTRPVLVVTGGYHSSALAAALEGWEPPGRVDSATIPASEAESPVAAPAILEQGIALTSYSYQRLDSLTGYGAGMPSPGFYEHAWAQRTAGAKFSHQTLLSALVVELRKRNQTLSTADLIAVETSARALAALRGREHVWRSDLVDAVTSSLLKDELEYGCESPFLEAVHAVLRGKRLGKLASATRRPPLVGDIQQQLAAADLEMSRGARLVDLNLLEPADRAKSRLLHRLHVLRIRGYEYKGGSDFLERDDLVKLWESWQVRWTTEFESSCIEASRYGTSLADAAAHCLLEQSQGIDRDIATATKLLLAAAQAGIDTISADLMQRLGTLLEQQSEFGAVTTALAHLLYLYCHDEVLGTSQSPAIGELLRRCYERSIWLLESLAQGSEKESQLVQGVKAIGECLERTGAKLSLDRSELIAVLERAQAQSSKPAAVRGAAAGLLWKLGDATSEKILEILLLFANPDQLGDFLMGLFALAREVVQRDAQLIRAIDQLLLEFASQEFQTSLPSLRLAFTFFTPREKHHMLSTLFTALGIKSSQPLARLQVDEQTAAEALALDERIFEAVARYGLEVRDE